MKTEIGEYIVGAYLKQRCGCEFVDYNVRPPGGGLEGLAELDVVGLNFSKREAFLCEVTTHLRGLHYGTYQESFERVRNKFRRQKVYAKKHLANFKTVHFMFWSPVVPRGKLTEALSQIKGLQLVINERYTECVNELRKLAQDTEHGTGNPFFRALQILEHLR